MSVYPIAVFFVSPGRGSDPYRMEYRFMDWFDGACRHVTGDKLMLNIWNWFECVWGEYDYEEESCQS